MKECNLTECPHVRDLERELAEARLSVSTCVEALRRALAHCETHAEPNAQPAAQPPDRAVEGVVDESGYLGAYEGRDLPQFGMVIATTESDRMKCYRMDGRRVSSFTPRFPVNSREYRVVWQRSFPGQIADSDPFAVFQS